MPTDVDLRLSATIMFIKMEDQWRCWCALYKAINHITLLLKKEAMAMIESTRKWSHFISKQIFTLVTDQQSVAFMFDSHRRSKIKNDKLQQWRLKLASFFV